MSEPPVNLNKWRKSRRKTEAKRQADANSVRFGTTPAQRRAAKEEEARERRRLDEHRREE